MKNKIQVFSSYATDRIVNKSGEITAIQKGGPVLFLEKALKNANVPYRLHFGSNIETEILKDGNTEIFGRVVNKLEKQTVKATPGSWIIISSIMGEWKLNGSSANSKIFVDIQGFVRDNKNFGKKKNWTGLGKVLNQIYCLKGTKEEITYLSKNLVEKQKKKLLVVTDGENGSDIFFDGFHSKVTVQKVISPKDTVGAGDTFLGHFVASMFKGFNPIKSAQIASEKTAIFLTEK